MDMALLSSKLSSFDPKVSYRSRTLDELNSLCNVLNDCKSKLSNSLQYYLQKYSKLMDIPRLCRALAVPGELAEQCVEELELLIYTIYERHSVANLSSCVAMKAVMA